MKIKPHLLKSTRLITLSTIAITWILTTYPVLADTNDPVVTNTLIAQDTPTVVPSTINPAAARERIQIDYAMRVIKQIAKALEVYKAIYQKAPSTAAFDWFADELMRMGDDPIIQDIVYEATSSHERITLIMHRHDFVEPLLHGIIFAYSRKTGSSRWKFDSNKSTIEENTIDNNPSMPIDYWKGVITKYCEQPLGIQFSNAKENQLDEVWCQEWFRVVKSFF